MRVILCLSVIFLLMVSSLCHALDFEITEVIEVGSIYRGGMLRPAQWSPDGVWLAYFQGQQLMIADSLGRTRSVAATEWVPRRFCWVDNSTIAIYEKLFLSAKESSHRLLKVDIVTGAQVVLEEFTRNTLTRRKNARREFAGPYLTVDGSAYYRVEEQGQGSVHMIPLGDGQRPSLRENRILRTGEDALYLVRSDFSDSLKISHHPYKPYVTLPMNLSRDRTHIMFGGTIVRLADDKVISLDTLPLVKNHPEDTYGCGICEESFNPVYSEVAFLLSCDDGHSYVVNRMGVFDYQSYNYQILDDMLGRTNCANPAYAPDGKRMSFVSDGTLYILRREID